MFILEEYDSKVAYSDNWLFGYIQGAVCTAIEEGCIIHSILINMQCWYTAILKSGSAQFGAIENNWSSILEYGIDRFN